MKPKLIKTSNGVILKRDFSHLKFIYVIEKETLHIEAIRFLKPNEIFSNSARVFQKFGRTIIINYFSLKADKEFMTVSPYLFSELARMLLEQNLEENNN